MWDDVRALDLATTIGRANPLSTMRQHADDQSILDLQHTGRCGGMCSWEYGKFCLSLSDVGPVTGGHLHGFLARGAFAQARIFTRHSVCFCSRPWEGCRRCIPGSKITKN